MTEQNKVLVTFARELYRGCWRRGEVRWGSGGGGVRWGTGLGGTTQAAAEVAIQPPLPAESNVPVMEEEGGGRNG